MDAALVVPQIPYGQVKSFGPVGPKYKVGRFLRPIDDYDAMVEVLLIETGETVEYRLSRIQDDPDAR